MKTTYDDIMDWMTEHEECAVTDGPAYLSLEEEREFLESLDKKIIREDSFYCLILDGTFFSPDQEEYLVNKFADFLNEKEYDNPFK